MGKRAKKVGSGLREKGGRSASSETDSQPLASNAVTPDVGVEVVKDREVCFHIGSGINLDKLSAKLGSSESLRCEDCRVNVVDRCASKGKQRKTGINSKSESKPIWICLECGHFTCRGVGLSTTPQSHAVRHAKQLRHPLAVHYKNPQLLWCFPCSRLIPAEKSEDNGENKDVLHEVAKMLKEQPEEVSVVNVEDVWSGSGTVTSALKFGEYLFL